MKQIKFSIDNWSYLYSLTQAIAQQKNNTGKTLQVKGHFSQKEMGLNECPISINFIHINGRPEYKEIEKAQLILGELFLNDKSAYAYIEVAEPVFNELKKNLVEYADIEGIHMVFSLELLSSQYSQQLKITELDYAMKGD